jgi:hypothetical protein
MGANMKNSSIKKLMAALAVCTAFVMSNAAADRPAMYDNAGDAVIPEAAATAQQSAMVDPMEPATQSAVEQTMMQQQGDSLAMPGTELQPGETLPVRLLDFPRRGMSMNIVQNELGRPIDISATVGQPPITSWSYDDRKVFFEGDIVIHVVATR